MRMRVLVTGGGGFLGGAIVRRLVARGEAVRSLSRGDYPELHALGVECFRGDVADADAVNRAAAGCDLVFHVAAKAGVWGPEDEYHQANVVGTQNVLDACRRHAISRLVYTSSPSVIHNGRDLEGVNESLPYPSHFDAAYPRTKAEAERRVLAANAATLATVALRPHLIWGPGDQQLVPRLIARAQAGQLRRIGRQEKRVDSIYIDNAAEAHLQAADRLAPGSPVAGKAYFISQGEPWPLWELINPNLAEAGLPPVTRHVPTWAAWMAGWMLETGYRLAGRTDEPRMTRFVAHQLSTAHWFDISAARRDFGYEATVSTEEGLRRLGAWLRTKPRQIGN
jgi:nucleoside-diphosphate-sugar epimerase